MELVTKRRSHEHFRSDLVPDASIEEIVDAARYALSACGEGESRSKAQIAECFAGRR